MTQTDAALLDEWTKQGLLERGATLRRASTIRPEPVTWAWADRWGLKSLNLVVGSPGKNKSMMVAERAARITRGQLEGDLDGTAHNVIIASAEDSPSHTQVPRLIAAGADLERVFFISMSRDGFEGDICLPDDLKALREAIERYEAKFIVIDPLTAHLGSDVNSHRDQDIRSVLGPLAHVADDTGCAVIAVVHLNKSPSTDLFMKVLGSIGITAAARSVLIVAQDPKEEEQSPSRVVVHAKCNIGPYADPLRFEVEGRKIDNEGEIIPTAGIVWRGVAEDILPRDVLGATASEAPAPKRDAAKDLLLELLEEGPMMAADIRRTAEEEGISWRTINAAKKDLGIASEQVQEPGRLGKGPSFWSLPGTPKAGVQRSPEPGVQSPNSLSVADLVSAGQRPDSDQVCSVQGVSADLVTDPPSEQLDIADVAEAFGAEILQRRQP